MDPEPSAAQPSPPVLDPRDQLEMALADRANRNGLPPKNGSGGSGGGPNGGGSGRSGSPSGPSRGMSFSSRGTKIPTIIVSFFKIASILFLVIVGGYVAYVAWANYGSSYFTFPGQGFSYSGPSFGTRMKFFAFGELWVLFITASIAWMGYLLQFIMEIANNTFR